MGKIKIKNISVGVKASFAYVVSSLLSRGLSIITVPIFTRLMSPEQIGVVNLFSSWNSTIDIFATLGLTSGGFFVALKEFSDVRDKYVASILFLTTCASLFLIFLYLSFSKTVQNFSGLSNTLIIFMLVGYIFTPARDFFLARQQFEYKYKISAGLIISSSIIASVVSVVAVVLGSKKGITALGELRIFSTYIIIYAIAFALWLIIFFKEGIQLNIHFWKFSLMLSVPLMGNAIAVQILTVSDRIMISKMVGNFAVGIYSILYSASALSSIVWQAINSSFIPFLFDGINKENKKNKIRRISTQLMTIYAIAAILLTLSAPEIIKILATREYYEAIYIMPPIAAGIFLNSLHQMYSNVILFYKKSYMIMIATSVAAIVNVVLNFFFIKKFGYMAAAYTTLIAHIVLVLIQFLSARKIHFKISGIYEPVYNDKKLISLSFVTIFLCLLCIPLYKFIYIRYGFISLIFIFIIIFRKKILNILKETKTMN